MSQNIGFDEKKLDEVANLGLEAMKEFLRSSMGMGTEQFERLKERAKVGCVAVATKVRHEAARNNGRALELMSARQLSTSE